MHTWSPQTAARIADTTTGSVGDPLQGDGRRILVVDDEQSIVDAVATALRYAGYEAEEASSGREAVSAVATLEPDLIVLDWMLPDIEGIDVARHLRAQGVKASRRPDSS